MSNIKILKERLQELSNLQDGWLDGSGKSISPKVIENVKYFIEDIISGVYTCPSLPHLYPTPEGGIQAEWEDGTEIEFSPCGAQIVA